MSSSLAALQAEREALLRSAREKDAELSSLRLQAQQQQGSLDLERDRISRELEALRAQLQQQVRTLQTCRQRCTILLLVCMCASCLRSSATGLFTVLRVKT